MSKPQRARWVAQTLNPRSASLRYRCIYPMAELARRGRDVGLWQPAESLDDSLALVFDGWSLFPSVSPPEKAENLLRLAHAAKEAGARIVLDNCDNQFAAQHYPEGWEDGQRRLQQMTRLADVLVTCSQALAEEMTRRIQVPAQLDVIDDPIEEAIVVPGDSWWKSLLSPARKRAQWILASHGVRIWQDRRAGRTPLVWFGSHGNHFSPGGMLDLLDKRDLFDQANRKSPISLTVISNHPAKFAANFSSWSFPTHYLEWDRTTFHRALRMHDISVIPSVANDFTRCKSSNRLALSVFHGLDVLADPVPSYMAYADYARIGDWEANLGWLLQNPHVRLRERARRRSALISMNGIEIISSKWDKALFGSAGSSPS